MDLIKKIEELKKSISKVVEKRIAEFEEMSKKEDLDWFSELCFCILTANTSAELGIKMQKNIKPEEFASMDEKYLAQKLKNSGYRFYNTRAKYIYENQKFAYNIKKILINKNDSDRREWLIKNIKGIGFKESSHFLRNVGYKNYAIIDKHIFKIMKENGLTSETKITEKNYLILENELKKISSNLGMDLATLDLYLWYMETGKILK
ncbi:MAG: N-glycosylase/DNA lyase [Thermoplasmata archaeon]